MFLLLTQNPNSFTSSRLIKEAKLMELETKVLNPFQGAVSFNSSKLVKRTMPCTLKENTIGLHRSSGISFDDFDLLFSENLIREGAFIENHPRVLRNFRDKEKQAFFFFEKEIPQIPTLSFRGHPHISILDEVDKAFYPYLKDDTFILKTNRGNRGLGVNIVRRKDSLLSFLETFWAMKDQRFILQPYIHEAEEFRVFLLRGECLGGVLKQQPKPFDFRKNCERSISSPKYFRPKSLPQEILKASQEAFESSGAFYLGLDFLVTSEGPLIIEMNCSPGFEQFEKLSEINIAREIILKLRASLI